MPQSTMCGTAADQDCPRYKVAALVVRKIYSNRNKPNKRYQHPQATDSPLSLFDDKESPNQI